MTPELQKYYENRFSTMGTDGWLDLMEGLMTLGTAFNFDNYNWFCWFVQALLVIMTISLSLKISSKMDEEN